MAAKGIDIDCSTASLDQLQSLSLKWLTKALIQTEV